jgi:Immunity protein 8
MRADLKELISMDPRAVPLEGFAAAAPTHFGISITALIGSSDSPAADSFDFFVCSPSWLSEHFDEPLGHAARTPEPDGVHFGNRLVSMKRWDYEALYKAIVALCSSFEAADWGTLASRIARTIPWEYDHRYDRFVDETVDQRPAFPPTVPD